MFGRPARWRLRRCFSTETTCDNSDFSSGICALIGRCVTSLTVFQQEEEFPSLRSIKHSCTPAATANVSIYTALTRTAAVLLLLLLLSYHIPTLNTNLIKTLIYKWPQLLLLTTVITTNTTSLTTVNITSKITTTTPTSVWSKEKQNVKIL